MLSIISTIFTIMKLLPQLKSIWDGVAVMWVQHEIAQMHADDIAAIKKAIEQKDQRDLETQIGSDRVGQNSGIDGTEHRDTLPNVGGAMTGNTGQITSGSPGSAGGTNIGGPK